MTQDIEFQSAETIKAFQEQKLHTALCYLKACSPYYRRMFDSYRINIDKIRHLEDLEKIPFTEKKTCNSSTTLLVRAQEQGHRLHHHLGHTGRPGHLLLHRARPAAAGLQREKSFACAGLHPGNILQLMTTIDKRFMAGLAYFLGIRELGASIIRVGNGIPELQWDTIERIKPDSVMCVPSFILRLIQWAEDHGIDYKHSSVKRIIGIGEGLRNQDFSLNLLGRKIKEKWDVDLYATYSSTEMGATFSECQYGQGGHVHPELIIVEIIGDDDMPVDDGQVGEVVVTTLGVEGMPLLRFRTGDVCAKVTAPCKCGRNSYRLTPLVGRKNNMIKLKGTTLYPPAINDVLDNIDIVENYVVTVQDSDSGTDDVIVKVGLKHPVDYDAVKALKDRFRAHLRVAPRVEIASPGEIQKINFPAKSRKPVKFIDLRKHDE